MPRGAWQFLVCRVVDEFGVTLEIEVKHMVRWTTLKNYSPWVHNFCIALFLTTMEQIGTRRLAQSPHYTQPCSEEPEHTLHDDLDLV